MTRLRSPALALLLASSACSSDPRSDEGPDSGGLTGSATDGAPTNDSGLTGASGPDETSSGPDDPGDDDVYFDVGDGNTGGSGDAPGGCSEASEDVYVIDEADRSLYRFHPPDRAFTKVGTPDCGTGIQPFSMAVSRDGVAYVLYVGDDYACDGVYAVDLKTGACGQKTSFSCGDQGFNTFGMGYSSEGKGSTDETLFVASGGGLLNPTASLGVLEPGSGTVSVVGDLDAAGVEFTGNTLGELWGFGAQDNPRKVVQIDKQTGGILTTYTLENLEGLGLFGSSTHWAWAFWGGDFYIFLRTAFDQETKVYRVFGEGGSGPAGDYETFMDGGTGLSIVGAGVSICAPINPQG